MGTGWTIRYVWSNILSVMTALEVRGLSSGYREEWVLRNISFSLEEGGFLVVLGRNGSGKSTLIKSILGLVPSRRGDVSIAGAPLDSLNPRQIAGRISYVPQSPVYLFEFSVFDIIAMGLYSRQGRWAGLSDGDRAGIGAIMDLLEIRTLGGKKLRHLSGGERQRVFIARALAQDTPLVLLDEPSTHLDIGYQVEIYALLKRLQVEQGKTILAAEHNINLVLPYARRLMLLKSGRIQNLGSPADLITQDNIRDVFDADVDVRRNPRTGLPEISLVPGEVQK